MSIHTPSAIKLEKREREAEPVDAQKIYITAETAREESVRERERDE